MTRYQLQGTRRKNVGRQAAAKSSVKQEQSDLQNVSQDTEVLISYNEKVRSLLNMLIYWKEMTGEPIRISDGSAPSPSSSASSPTKRPRLSSDQEQASQSDATPGNRLRHKQRGEDRYVSGGTTYKWKNAWRGRRVAVTPHSAQSLPQLLQYALLPDTVDVDVHNCMMTLLPQIIAKFELNARWETQIKLLQKLAEHRDTLCEKSLKVSVAEGKHLLLATLAGQKLSTRWETNQFMRNVQRLSVWLRWVAVSYAPDVFTQLKENPDTSWPEASCFANLWMPVEDAIAECLALFSLELGAIKHCSLHFDGARLDKKAVRR